jgi:hypothetical protein
MAGIEEELGKPTEEPDAEPRELRQDSVQAELPGDGGDSKPSEKLTTAEALPPVEEPSDIAPFELQAPKEHELSMATPAQNSEPEVPKAEVRAPEPSAPTAQPAVAEPAKPRSLFPALVATALAGALLGIGGSYGLRFIESQRIKPQPSDDRLSEFNARLDAIEGKEAAASSASRSALSALEARVAAAEGAARNASESAKAAETDIQKLAASQPAAEQPSNVSTAPAEAPDLGPLEARLTALEKKLAQTESEATAPKTSRRAEPDQENASAKEATRVEKIAIVAENLLRKLDHGEDFSADLSTLEDLGIPQAALAPLRAASGSVVSTIRELTAQFAALSGKIIAAESTAQAGPDESFLDRLTRNAKSLVDVRRVSESSAADVQSLVTRIETALADHDVEVAYKAWTQLPSFARNVAQSWGEAAKARLDALNAAKSIEADAVAVLAKPKR